MPRKKRHSSGLHRKSITVGRKSDGTPIRRFVYGNTIAECEEKIAKIRIEMNMGIAQTENKSTWEYWTDTWKTLKFNQITEATKGAYSGYLGHLACLNRKKVSELTSLDMALIVNKMHSDGYGKRTIKSVILIASQICALARRNGAMYINITEDIAPPSTAPETKRDSLDKEAQDMLWNVSPIRGETAADKLRETRLPLIRMIALLCLCCGLRRGEVVALLWSDIDFSNRCLHISKSYDFKGKRLKEPKTSAGIRKIPVSNRCIDELKKWKAICPESIFVFPGASGCLSEGEYAILWNTLLDAINGITVSKRISTGRIKNTPVEKLSHKIKFTSHDLRHTYATNGIAMGIDIKTMQYLLGHAQASTLLDIYAHFSQEAWNSAADLLNNYDSNSIMVAIKRH